MPTSPDALQKAVFKGQVTLVKLLLEQPNAEELLRYTNDIGQNVLMGVAFHLRGEVLGPLLTHPCGPELLTEG